MVPQAEPMLAAQAAAARHGAPVVPPEAASPRAAPSAPAPAAVAPATLGETAATDAEAPIVEPHTADIAGHAFGSLRDTLRAQKEAATASMALPEASAISSHSGGPTVEDMIRQELRPLLKAWLDAQLPELVERVVRAEIARIVERTRD